MAVIIDQLDLVDTEADPPREAGSPVPRQEPAVPDQTVAVLRRAARRSARVRAD